MRHELDSVVLLSIMLSVSAGFGLTSLCEGSVRTNAVHSAHSRHLRSELLLRVRWAQTKIVTQRVQVPNPKP